MVPARLSVLLRMSNPLRYFAPEYMLAACIPNSRLRVVECGHLFLLTRAKTLAPQIEVFLSFES